ncbi:MAG: hypothetical protein MI741_00620, partial [Rhodospirillales bacterium]|nr:hypothetical protein [Rhodospirillales bacterium]
VALVALLTGVGYWQYHVNTRAAQPRWQTMQAYFDQTVASGFNPQAPDETDALFANACNERLGQAVMARTLPEESRLLGIDHTHILSTETVVLYAKVNEQPVLVFAERVDATRSAQPMQGNLNRHQKQVGGIMLYEVSRLENPQLLNHFFTSDRKNSPLSQHRRGEAVITS